VECVDILCVTGKDLSLQLIRQGSIKVDEGHTIREASTLTYTLSEAWSVVNWADLMATQGAFGTDFYVRSTGTIV